MQTYVIMGRNEKDSKTHDRRGCACLGRLVNYPNGRYEETGELFLEIAHPHCTLVVGKRGTGKSHTLGVMAEGYALLDRDIRNRTCVIMVDTLGVFGGLGHDIRGANGDCDIGRSVRLLRPGNCGNIRFSWRDLSAFDLLRAFGLSPVDPSGALLCNVWEELGSFWNPFGLDEIIQEIRSSRAPDHIQDGLVYLFTSLAHSGILDKVGSRISDLMVPGSIAILDLSHMSPGGSWDPRDLMVSLLVRRIQSLQASRDGPGRVPLVNLMIDEAHLFMPSNSGTLSRGPLTDWIKLGRSQGLGTVLATQEPSALDPSAIRQSDIIVAHYLTSRDDLDALSAARSINSRSGKAVEEFAAGLEMKRGLAAVFDDRSGEVELCQVRNRYTRSGGKDGNAMDEVVDVSVDHTMDQTEEDRPADRAMVLWEDGELERVKW